MVENLIKIDDTTYRYEDGFVRCFLLVGKEKALWIDTGVSCTDLQAIAKEVTDLPQLLLNTHSDGDHVSGNGAFKEFYMHTADYKSEVAERFPNSKQVSVREGDVIELGDRPLEIWEIPGHTKGSIAIYDKKMRRLIVGDSVQTGHIYMFGSHRAPECFEETLQKLSLRKPLFDEVLPSHGDPILSSDSVDKVAECWRQVQEGKIEGHKENLHGFEIVSYDAGYCGFYCEK